MWKELVNYGVLGIIAVCFLLSLRHLLMVTWPKIQKTHQEDLANQAAANAATLKEQREKFSELLTSERDHARAMREAEHATISKVLDLISDRNRENSEGIASALKDLQRETKQQTTVLGTMLAGVQRVEGIVQACCQRAGDAVTLGTDRVTKGERT